MCRTGNPVDIQGYMMNQYENNSKINDNRVGMRTIDMNK